MKFRLILIIAIISAAALSAQVKESEKLHNMSKFEIDELLIEISSKDMTVTEKMNFYSERFLGMPYNLTCAGDGPYALYETWPLVTFDETNCMVFCEHVLALAVSDSWDNFFNNLQQIRYKDGMIGMRTRNHYTIADWLPENSWLLDDVSAKVGGEFAKKVTRTISHKEFFKGKGIEDLRYVKEDRTITIDYIPLSALGKIKDNLKTGDILALLFANLDNIFSAHMLMVAEKDGKMYIRESSNSKMTTFDTLYEKWISSKFNSKRYLGIAVMRVKDEINTPGRIILPWNITNMRAK